MNRPKVAVFLLCVCFVSLAGLAQTGSEADIKALIDQSRQAALNGDSSYADSMSDDYTRTNFNGSVDGKSAYVNALKTGAVKYQSIEYSDLKVRVYGDAAVVTYRAQVKATSNGRDTSGSYRVTRTFVKRNARWQEVAFQSTKAP